MRRVENYDDGSGKLSLTEGTSIFAQGISIEKSETGGTPLGYERSTMLYMIDDAIYPDGAIQSHTGISINQSPDGSAINGGNGGNALTALYMGQHLASGYTSKYGIRQGWLYANGNMFNGDVDLWYSTESRIRLHANAATLGAAYIWCGGDIVAYASFSDKRLKKDIEYLDQKECLDKILKLDGVSFNWIDTDTDQSRQIGFIAQETEKIIPEVVKTRVNPAEDGKKFKKMNYDKLTPFLVEAIKEQQDMINDLKTEINILKNRIGD